MPDDRFIRDGRTLREWLPDLIDPMPLTRRRAENAVSAMWWGAPIADATTYLHLPADPEAHRAEWGRHISDIINDPAFDGAAFIDAALARMREDRRAVARVAGPCGRGRRRAARPARRDRGTRRTDRSLGWAIWRIVSPGPHR